MNQALFKYVKLSNSQHLPSLGWDNPEHMSFHCTSSTSSNSTFNPDQLTARNHNWAHRVLVCFGFFLFGHRTPVHCSFYRISQTGLKDTKEVLRNTFFHSCAHRHGLWHFTWPSCAWRKIISLRKYKNAQKLPIVCWKVNGASKFDWELSRDVIGCQPSSGTQFGNLCLQDARYEGKHGTAIISLLSPQIWQ